MAGIAIRRLMRGEDGSIRVALVDLNTLKEVTDPTDYTVIEPDNGTIEDIPIANMPKSSQQVAAPGEVPPEASTVKEAQEYIASGGKLDSAEAAQGMTGRERDATNNFGYMSKPKGLGLASMLPGPAGMVGKVVNAGINANNMTASEKARGYLGLSPSSTFGKVKGVLSDNKGVVSKSANIGGFDYGITFGGVNPDGTTSLTPDEARTRSLTMDAPVKEGEVSERGQSYRTPSQTGNVQPSTKAPGTLGQNSYSQTGTRQGLAGKLGGIQAQELGTVAGAAFPSDMESMPNISAPLGIDAENEADMSGRMSRQWAGSLGDVPARSVKTGVVGATPSSRPQNVNLGAVTPSEKSNISSNAKNISGFDKAKDVSGMAEKGYRSSAVTDPTESSNLSPSQQKAVSDAYGAAYSAGLTGLSADMSVAQAMHESAWGAKPAGTSNLHGIKAAKGTPVMTHEVENGKSVKKSQNFANFTNPEDSFRGWGALMARNYPGVLSAEDEAQAIDGLSKGRLGAYATDPNYGKKIAATLDKTRGFGFKAVGPVSAFNAPSLTGQISAPADTYADPEATMSPEKTAALAGKVNSGYGPQGLMGNLASPSSPASRMGASGSSFSPSSPGGMTGFGRTTGTADSGSALSGAARGMGTSLGGGTGSRSTGPSKGTGSVADGSKGNESYGGGRVSSGATGGFADGRKGSESYGGGSTTSSSKSSSSSGMGKSLGGNPGAGAYGGSSAGSSKSSSSSSSSKGSASSANNGNSRGGMSSGRGMGGFN